MVFKVDIRGGEVVFSDEHGLAVAQSHIEWIHIDRLGSKRQVRERVLMVDVKCPVCKQFEELKFRGRFFKGGL